MNTQEARSNLYSKLQNNLTIPDNVQEDKSEYLLNPENNRLTVYPIRHQDLWALFKEQQASYWKAEEVNLEKDSGDYNNLTPGEQHFIKSVLAFFSSSDTIVNINLVERFVKEVKLREANVCYTWQMMMENIHSEMYSLQIDNIIKDPEEKEKLFDSITQYPCIAEKANWAAKWIESTENFAHRLLAFAIFEGIFFSGSFCAIFWFKKRNLMPGLCASNELIARDEGAHTNFAVKLYSMLSSRLSEEDAHQMFVEAVEIERKFICDSLPCALLGMNADLMHTYIKFVADRLLVSLGYNKIFKESNPFDFMELISMETKTNFFEDRPTQYQDSLVLNKTKHEAFDFSPNF